MGAVLGGDLAIQRFDMQLDGHFLQVKFAGDFFVGKAATQTFQHIQFARGQLGTRNGRGAASRSVIKLIGA